MSSPDRLPPVISGPPELPVLPAPRRKRRVLPVGDFLHPITLMMIKPVERAGTRSARMEAARRCALAVVEVERFRAANGGRLPTSLEELPAPTDRSLRTDPFGDALKYRVLEVGYVVYSLGPDRIDDGGVPKRPSREPSAPKDAAIAIRR